MGWAGGGGCRGLPSPENLVILGGIPASARVVPVVLTRDGEDRGWEAWWTSLGLAPWYVGPYRDGLAEEVVAEVMP